MLLSVHVTSVLLLVRFNNFTLTMGLELHTLTLVAHFYALLVKASSLHLTTGTGGLQSCSPLLHYPLSARAQESGNEAGDISNVAMCAWDLCILDWMERC